LNINIPENQLTKFHAVYTVKVNRNLFGNQNVVVSCLYRTHSEKKSKITNAWGSLGPTPIQPPHLNDAPATCPQTTY